MILVTGATGTIGSALVDELLARDAEVLALTRDPRKIEPRRHLTVTTAIDRAVDAAFLLAPPGPGIPEADLAMVAAVTRAGCRRLVKLSAIGTPDHDDHALLGSWHRPGEKAVRESGLGWTILRPTSFAANTLAWAGAIRAGRPVANPFADGRQGVVDPRDVAAVAAEVLLNPGHDRMIYTPTGPDLVTLADQVATLSDILETPISTVDVRPDENTVAGAGAALVRRGGNAIVTPDVHKVLGRTPRTFRTWAEDHRHRF